MAVLKIFKYGEPVLRKPAAPVAVVTADIRALIADMLETMYASRGVGLAAPQVGVSLRVCVIDHHPDGRPAPIALINPVIEARGPVIEEEEGCLSFPGLAAIVKRNSTVRVSALDARGRKTVITGEGLLSRALQHEIDHLDGTVFIDYIPLWRRKKIVKIIQERRTQGDW